MRTFYSLFIFVCQSSKLSEWQTNSGNVNRCAAEVQLEIIVMFFNKLIEFTNIS